MNAQPQRAEDPKPGKPPSPWPAFILNHSLFLGEGIKAIKPNVRFTLALTINPTQSKGSVVIAGVGLAKFTGTPQEEECLEDFTPELDRTVFAGLPSISSPDKFLLEGDFLIQHAIWFAQQTMGMNRFKLTINCPSKDTVLFTLRCKGKEHSTLVYKDRCQDLFEFSDL